MRNFLIVGCVWLGVTLVSNRDAVVAMMIIPRTPDGTWVFPRFRARDTAKRIGSIEQCLHSMSLQSLSSKLGLRYEDMFSTCLSLCRNNWFSGEGDSCSLVEKTYDILKTSKENSEKIRDLSFFLEEDFLNKLKGYAESSEVDMVRSGEKLEAMEEVFSPVPGEGASAYIKRCDEAYRNKYDISPTGRFYERNRFVLFNILENLEKNNETLLMKEAAIVEIGALAGGNIELFKRDLVILNKCKIFGLSGLQAEIFAILASKADYLENCITVRALMFLYDYLGGDKGDREKMRSIIKGFTEE
ncbi:MAG: hypothetical protein LBJ96_01260 [Holosporaceae bacterium]|jgi:hypothetical protein|nr:hypothetical protein [Holosporaceae bacterium]